MFEKLGVGGVGVLVFEDMQGHFGRMHQIAELRQPGAVAGVGVELVGGGDAELVILNSVGAVETQAVEHPFQLLKSQVLSLVEAIDKVWNFVHAAHGVQRLHQFGEGEREVDVLFVGFEQEEQ